MSRAADTVLSSPGLGRSTLLRAGVMSPPRPRPYGLRRLVVAALLGALGALVLAVRAEAFPVSGPYLLLYWLHDAIWLPIYGRVWIAPFPGGLVWLVPLAVLAAAVLAEFLGLAAPVRWAQLRLLSRTLRGPRWRLVLGWHRLLGFVGRCALLAEAILREDQADARDAVEQAVEQGGDRVAALARLAEVQRRILSFGLLAPREAMAVLETLALAHLSGTAAEPALVDLRAQAARVCAAVCPDWEHLLDLVEADISPGAVPRLAGQIADPGRTETELAARSVGIALAVARDGRAEHMVWFDEWARRRAGRDADLAQRLGRAEAMIGFEFWAGLSEAAVTAPPLAPMLHGAFAGLAPVRPRGERFARAGALTGVEKPT